MTSNVLHRAVSRATGENLRTILRMGFQPLRRRPFELDPESYGPDWDQLQAERQVAYFPARQRGEAIA